MDGSDEDREWIVGIPDEKPPEGQRITVHPDHWPAVELFLGCATQWRMAVGMGGVATTGLDYAAVHAVMQIQQTESPAEVFGNLRMLERGYLAASAGQTLEELLSKA